MSTTLQYMVPGNQETAPAISHVNFHRVHGAQVAVLCGTCIENPYEPVENL